MKCYGCGTENRYLADVEVGNMTIQLCEDSRYTYGRVKEGCRSKAYARMKRENICVLCGEDSRWPVCSECVRTYTFGKQHLEAGDDIATSALRGLASAVGRLRIYDSSSAHTVSRFLCNILNGNRTPDYNDPVEQVMKRAILGVISYMSNEMEKRYIRGFKDGSNALERLIPLNA